jgi:predicted MFS family arabinose efflux permease
LQSVRVPLRPAYFGPFRVRSFRFQWPADLLTSCGFEMETLILGWYVLTATGSVLLLTLYGSMQFVGTLVAPLFGVIGDRIGHRNLLCFMRAVYAILATTLMSIAFAGAITPAVVFVIAGLMGIVRPSDLGVRQALVADIMPANQLVGAMGMSRTNQDLARVAGALSGAGLFAAFGMATAYVVVASSYTLGLLLTLCIKAGRTEHALGAAPYPRPSAWLDVREAIAYVWSRPQLLAAMLLACLVNMTAYPLSNGLLPYVARDVYHIDQTGLGYLVASFALGALLGSLTVSLRAAAQQFRLMIICAAAWYAALLVFAHMRTPAAGLATLALAGFAQSYSIVSSAVLLIRNTEPRFRGRVMGVRMLAIYSLPLGLLAAGALVELIGFATTASLYAITGLIFTLVIGLRYRTAPA